MDSTDVDSVLGPANPRVVWDGIDVVAAKYERAAKMIEARRKVAAEKAAKADREFQAALALPVEDESPEFRMVRAGDVMFDRRYQTDERYDEGRAKRIAATYQYTRCDPIKVNIRPGDATETLWCFDGRHRVEATKMRCHPDEPMKALLHRVPYETEARLFAEQDQNVKRVPFPIKFMAQVEAGDPEAMAIYELAQSLGIGFGRRAFERIIATATFLECCRMKGLAATETGLSFLLEAWHGQRASLESHIAKGMVWFIAHRESHPNFDARRFQVVLTRISVAELELRASAQPSGTHHQRVAAALIDEYNRHRRGDLDLPRWDFRREK